MVSALVAPGPAVNTPSVLAPELEGLATCPSCHTQDPSTTDLAVNAGAAWHCARCGSRWDAVRLATVAAYEMWLATRASSTVDPALHAVAAA